MMHVAATEHVISINDVVNSIRISRGIPEMLVPKNFLSTGGNRSFVHFYAKESDLWDGEEQAFNFIIEKGQYIQQYEFVDNRIKIVTPLYIMFSSGALSDVRG